MNENLALRTVPVGDASGEIYKDINELTRKNIEAGTLPYLADLDQRPPLPEDMNVVTGKHLGDMNKIHVELKASSENARSLRWIFGADAAALGLETKEGEEPLIAYASVTRDGKTEQDAQAIYLMDQFTEESLARLYDPKAIGKAVLLSQDSEGAKKISVIVKKALQNITEYDTGKSEEKIRKAMRGNIRENLGSTENPVREVILGTKGRLEGPMTAAQEAALGRLISYFTTQKTGLRFTGGAKDISEKEMADALLELSKKDSPALTELLTDAYLFADRTARPEFGFGKAYGKEWEKEAQKVRVPEAGRFTRPFGERDRQRAQKKEREIIHERKAPAQTRGRY